MTAVHTPGSPGGRTRNRVIASSAGIFVAACLLIGASMLTTASSEPNKPKAGDVSCEQLAQDAADALVKVDELDRGQYTSGKVGKAQYEAELGKRRLEAAEAQKKASECVSSETTTTVAGTPTTVVSQPSPDDCYTTPVFAANGRTDNRFGDQPVTISGPQDVDKVVQAKVDNYCTDPFQVAKDSQNDYLGNPGINTEEVQALANSYVADHAKWKHDAEVLRARLGRATFELKRTNDAYHTEEAIPGGDSSSTRAPAAKDATSHGERWVLVTHMSAEDGGRMLEEVVNCNFQKHVTIEAPPATPVPSPHTTTPPATTVPPVVTTTTRPPVTTTTRPPATTTTQPDKDEPDTRPPSE